MNTKSKLNSNDKVSIRAIVLNMREYKSNDSGMLKKIDPGSNIYTVCYKYSLADGIRYSVLKHEKSGKFVGDAPIIRISEHGLEYNNCNSQISLPASVSIYIRDFNNYLNAFIKYGEQAFNF